MTPIFLEAAVNTGSVSSGGTGRRGSRTTGSSGNGPVMRHSVIDVIPIETARLKELIVYFRQVRSIQFICSIKIIDAGCCCDYNTYRHS